MSVSTNESLSVRESVLEVRISAPRTSVWKALTEDIGEWWPAATFCVGGDSAEFRLDARVGGHMVEEWGGGQGLVWGTVTMIKENETLCLTGDLFAEYGGPSRIQSSYKLEEDGDETVLRFRESHFGRIGDQVGASLERGWKYLLDGCLKAYLEGNEAPEWTDDPSSSCS